MRRDKGTVHLDTGHPIVLAPPLAPGTPSQAHAQPIKTTLSRPAEPGQARLWTAVPLPDGATVRIDGETAVVCETFYKVVDFAAYLAEPLVMGHDIASVVTVIARKGECAHLEAVPVDLLLGGERVAWYCPACEAQLPAEWKENSDA